MYGALIRSQAIQAATASEPLSLAEEYAMQQSWRNDGDKLTFITCKPLPDITASVISTTHDASSRMVGDINLFLARDEGNADHIIGELELMVVRKEQQRKGYGRASLVAFTNYVLTHQTAIMREYTGSYGSTTKLQLECLRVKVGQDNFRSITLFESIGFKKLTESPNYFGEFELRTLGKLSELQRSLIAPLDYTELSYKKP